jgi:single-strand DNA-binding protein
MSDMNSVNIIGRLTRDAELKYTANGTAVCKFSVAVNEKRKIGDEWKDQANFFEIVLWGKVGESISQYMTKGKQVAITGKLTQERWDQDGQSRQKVVITAATVQFLGGGSGDSGESRNSREYSAHEDPPVRSARPDVYTRDVPKGRAASAPDADDGFADDIPF